MTAGVRWWPLILIVISIMLHNEHWVIVCDADNSQSFIFYKVLATLGFSTHHNQTDPCQLLHVYCADGTNVSEIWLSDYGLNGHIPSEIGSLKSLSYLDLSVNKIQGLLPSHLGNLSKLQYLDLSTNKLSGSIPSQLGNLLNLQKLHLSSNQLSGSIPSQLGNLLNLQNLHLSSNQLSGSIPSQLCNLLNLQNLHLSSNQLSGSISSQLGNLTYLIDLDLSSNQLSGSIPSQLGNLLNLQNLHLSSNQLSGSIPSQLGNLLNLQNLHLSSNQHSGSIPSQLGNLTYLIDLDLSSNQLSGSIPSQLGNLTYLIDLDLSSNQLSGSIPSQLGNLLNLQNLHLSSNQLSGSIPSQLGNLLNLQNLDLSSNQLSGSIPSQLGNLLNLQNLDLSSNQLSGSIPSQLGNLLNLQNLDLSSNQLSGSIPSQLGNLLNLQNLDLSSNQLSGSIPPDLVSLSCPINLSNNQLSSRIPSEMLPYISNFNVSGNHVDGYTPANSYSQAPLTISKTLIMLIPIIIVIGSVICIVFVVLSRHCLCGSFIKTRDSPTNNQQQQQQQQQRDDNNTRLKTGNYIMYPCPTANRLIVLTAKQISEFTQEFHPNKIIGRGSIGTVYKATLPNGILLAIKKFDLEFQHDEALKCFNREVQTLGRIKHKNLVQVFGCCSELDLLVLMLEYMHNGSLHDWLYEKSISLRWKIRLKIAIDVANALVYLHHECFIKIVHGDLKPRNILLDFSMDGHVSDFGISRVIGRDNIGYSTSSLHFLGSIGYIAPEYALNGRASTEGDVYSFGVVLLELLTGLSPCGENCSYETEGSLSKWIISLLKNKSLKELVDSRVIPINFDDGNIDYEEAQAVLKLALLCTDDRPNLRPSIKDVRNILLKIKNL